MERLTKRLNDGTVIAWHPLQYYNYNDFKKVLERLAYYEDLEEEGRLAILSIQDIHPCRCCDTGWGSISSEGCHGCEETCERLKRYNEKYYENQRTI